MSSKGIDALLRVSQIITGAFMSGQLVFLVGCYVATQGNTEPRGGALVVSIALTAMALGTAVASVLSRLHFLGGLGVGLLAPRDLSPADPVSPEVLEGELQSLRGRYQTGQIISLAMAEATTIIGLVLAIQSQAWPLMLPFMLLGIGLCAFLFPTPSGVASLLSPGARAALKG